MAQRLEDLKIYHLSMEIGDDIWQIVADWPFFAKDTIGKQIVRSADSIALNIAEGHGRYHFKENKHFCLIARGSLIETKSALSKSLNRALLSEAEFQRIMLKMEQLYTMLNSFIKKIGTS